MTDRELVSKACAMLERAYAPYSHFPVGAALLCRDGSVFTGCNVENASYGVSICAERTAVVKAVSEGHQTDWVRLAVVGKTKDSCWPCGVCRQMLFEFAPDLELLIGNQNQDPKQDPSFVKIRLADLLPYGFGPHTLLA